MRYAIFVLICAVSVLPMMGCPPLSDFQVTSPTANDIDSVEYSIVDGKIVIDVFFSDIISMGSLVAGDNVVLETELYANANIFFQPNTTSGIRITSAADYGDLLVFNPDGFFSLHLQPAGSSPIYAFSGKQLDGDDDGRAGGEWETGFVYLGK